MTPETAAPTKPKHVRKPAAKKQVIVTSAPIAPPVPKESRQARRARERRDRKVKAAVISGTERAIARRGRFKKALVQETGLHPDVVEANLRQAEMRLMLAEPGLGEV